MNLQDNIRTIAQNAKAASYVLARLDGDTRATLLKQMHAQLLSDRQKILDANVQDVGGAEKSGLSKPLLERLVLDAKRFDTMLTGLTKVTTQSDPLGAVIEKKTLPNGIELSKIRVPIGVVGMIYESRPNVTCEAASLCFKSGNAVILKGGKGEARVRAAYPGLTWQRLTEIKNKYDPNNLFHLNQNIPPAK